MRSPQIQKKQITGAFKHAAHPKTKRRRTPPFSLRLTNEERELLNRKAGKKPLGSYIREQLLGGQAQPRQKVRKVRYDDKLIAQLLAELGQSRIPSNLNQLAKAVNTGTLGLPSDVERDLLEACRAIISMRDNLLVALGGKPEVFSRENGA